MYHNNPMAIVLNYVIFFLLRYIYNAKNNKASTNNKQYKDECSPIVVKAANFFTNLHDFLSDELNYSDLNCNESGINNAGQSNCDDKLISECTGVQNNYVKEQLICDEQYCSSSYLQSSTSNNIIKNNVSYAPQTLDINQGFSSFSVPIPSCLFAPTGISYVQSMPVNVSLAYIKNVLRSVLFYRYSICYFFNNYYKQKEIENDQCLISNGNMWLFSYLTLVCYEFSKSQHNSQFEYNDNSSIETVNTEEYKLLQHHEKRIITESQKKTCDHNFSILQWELKNIRKYNRQRVSAITQIISNTIISNLYSKLKFIFTESINLEAHTDMLLSLHRSLYELSLFYYENVNIRIRYKFKDTVQKSWFCIISHCEDNVNFIFYWAFNWLYFFSYHNIINYFPGEHSQDKFKNMLVSEFLVQSIILIHLLYNYNNKDDVHYENDTFFTNWKSNIIKLMFTYQNNREECYGYAILLKFFCEIREIYQPKFLLKATPKYVRILLTSYENINNSYKLDPIIIKYITLVLKASHQAFIKTKSEHLNTK